MPKHEYGREGAQLQSQFLKRLMLWVGLPLVASIALVVVSLTFRVPWVCSLPLVLLSPALPAAMKLWERHADKAIDPIVTGFRGERDVADALRVLGDDCYLLHDVDFGRGNVDHIVVAPSGIYSVETKAWAGTVHTDGDRLLVNGYDHARELKQAFAEAMAVRDHLKKVSFGHEYFVTPLLVFTRAKVSATGKCRGVFVLRLDRLAGFIQKGAPRLERLERARIAGRSLRRCPSGSEDGPGPRRS